MYSLLIGFEVWGCSVLFFIIINQECHRKGGWGWEGVWARMSDVALAKISK